MHMAAARHGRQHVALGAGKASRTERKERCELKERRRRQSDELAVYLDLVIQRDQGVGS